MEAKAFHKHLGELTRSGDPLNGKSDLGSSTILLKFFAGVVEAHDHKKQKHIRLLLENKLGIFKY